MYLSTKYSCPALVTNSYYSFRVLHNLRCSSVISKASVPYRHAGVTQVLMTLPISLCEIRRFAITPPPPQLLSTRSLRPVLFNAPLSLSVFPPSPHTAPPRYTKLSP